MIAPAIFSTPSAMGWTIASWEPWSVLKLCYRKHWPQSNGLFKHRRSVQIWVAFSFLWIKHAIFLYKCSSSILNLEWKDLFYFLSNILKFLCFKKVFHEKLGVVYIFNARLNNNCDKLYQLKTDSFTICLHTGYSHSILGQVLSLFEFMIGFTAAYLMHTNRKKVGKLYIIEETSNYKVKEYLHFIIKNTWR